MTENNTQLAEVKAETKPAVSRNKVTDFSLGIYGSSDNFTMAWQMAQALAASTIVPQTYQNNPSNTLIALEMSQRLKASPIMIMQNLFPIQGRPSWSAQFLIAMINASGKYDMELQFEEVKDKDGKPFSCKCYTTKAGRVIEGPVIDMNMANAEGWTKKNGSKWLTMPQIMLRYRAAAFFARMNCPELTLGFHTQEEVIDGNFEDITPMDELSAQVKNDIENNANTIEFPASTDEEPGF